MQFIRVQCQIKYVWKDIGIGIDVVMRCRSASWWEWLCGYKLFFWRWSKNHREQTRYSGKVYIYGNLPRFRKPQYIKKLSDLTLVKGKKLENLENEDIYLEVRS